MNILEKLCFYDPRNPSYQEENGPRPKPCYCDNCFYGRDGLAKRIIELEAKLQEALNDHQHP